MLYLVVDLSAMTYLFGEDPVRENARNHYGLAIRLDKFPGTKENELWTRAKKMNPEIDS